MATPSAQMTLNGLARRLVSDGHLAEADALKAQEESDKKKSPLVSYLVEKKLLDGKIIATAASRNSASPYLI